MTRESTDYLRRLKAALTGDPATPLAFLCNFEVETQWARHHVGLPAPAAAPTAVVQRMEELGILLAGPDDLIVVKNAPDEGYLRYLAEDLGVGLPAVLVPERTSEDRPTAEDLLNSPLALDRLSRLGRLGTRLIPMGTSESEEKLAVSAQVPLAVPDAATFERVNSKIYSRRVTEELGLPAVPGWCCETLGELRQALAEAAAVPGSVVVKDAYGVSGKGLVVLDTPAKADRLLRLVERRAARTGDDRLALVVERWIDKRADLNYQITVDRRGGVRLDFVKQALTERGVHQGHLMPADLNAGQHALLRHAAAEVGGRLAADGFFGVAGIDAIVGADERVHPVLEINARFNMSTYQGGITELFHRPGDVALARHYPVRPAGPIGFDDLRRALGTLLSPAPGGRVIVTCFGTVNAGATNTGAVNTGAADAGGDGPRHQGRLYTLLTAPDHDRLAALDGAVRAALAGVIQPREDS
ncbi:ATP-grasp domain-containing protein [Microbispora sp. RL4-1S]|uniref:ATP-grasp domain-containing protein n=1 Tax=Microbispora oryzae TaxID=2806554 RepID=A0A941ARW9_9ACTN|nr:ATP-grasp domain-containing protein [Microbispora oryzae]MBP2706799.1 ATP-grasp domain-containing protein [Microbispora oryzae]